MADTVMPNKNEVRNYLIRFCLITEAISFVLFLIWKGFLSGYYDLTYMYAFTLLIGGLVTHFGLHGNKNLPKKGEDGYSFGFSPIIVVYASMYGAALAISSILGRSVLAGIIIMPPVAIMAGFWVLKNIKTNSSENDTYEREPYEPRQTGEQRSVMGTGDNLERPKHTSHGSAC